MSDVIAICNNRCGSNWHRFCATTECQYFTRMILESDKVKASFCTIGDAKKDNKNG